MPDDKEYIEEIKAKVCPVCHVGMLKQHPQAAEKPFRDTLKCGTCGFAKIVPRRRDALI